MWLLGTRAMFRSVRKFGESGTGFLCKVCRAGGRKAADEFHFEDVKLKCLRVCVFSAICSMIQVGWNKAVAAWVRALWMKFR